MFLGSTQVFAVNRFYPEWKKQAKIGRITDSIYSAVQVRCAYGARTDGQPENCGYAARGVTSDEDAWLLYEFTYDVNDQLTLRQVAFDAWDNYATATYL